MSTPLHSLNDIPALLAQLAQDIMAALERQPAERERKALEQLLGWTLAHQHRFQAVARRLEDSRDAALMRDWLVHAPALETPPPGPAPADALVLWQRAAALEAYLFALIGQLLQHSGSGWASELYRSLLDHALGAALLAARRPC